MSTATQLKLAPAETARWTATECIAAETARACEQRYGRRLRGVILTGSLAREEGTAIVTDGACRILGDAEFLLVFNRNGAIPRREELSSLAQTISRAVRERQVECRVDLAGVAPAYLRHLPRHIFSYELRNAGRVIQGDPAISRLVPEFPPADIEREDAWRLLSNRMVEWLEALAEAPAGVPTPKIELFYATVKLWVDAAASLLVFLNGYEPSYRGRAARLAALAAERNTLPELPFPLPEFSRAVEQATRWKLAPESSMAQRAGWAFCEHARHLAGGLWSWELGQLTGLDPGLPVLHLAQAWGRRTGLAGRWRGWLRATRELGWLNSRPHWRRWRKLARSGSPRHWIYALAAECVLREDDFSPWSQEGVASTQRIRALRRFLPEPRSGDECGWRTFARDLAWDYHEFVERTRA